MNALDHVVVAAPDLDAASAWFESETGVAPVPGGPHPGLGTRNALASFGDGTYLEIIAPDPAQEAGGSLGERLAAMGAPALFHWAVRADDLGAVARRARSAGFEPSAVIDAARELPSGQRLTWKLLGIGGHALGGVVPFYIDWLETPHPSATSPPVGELLRFEVRASNAGLAALLDPLPEGVHLADAPGATRGLAFGFQSPMGPVDWTSDGPPLGFPL